MKELESIGALETLKDMVALIDTSERLRGLEFPIVIVYDIGFTEKTLLLINAYARATTRVIGIYSIWSLKLFENPNVEKEPFIVEVLKNPEIAEAVKNPWTYILKKLGWELHSVATLSGSIFWNISLGVWVVHTDNPAYRLEEQMWIAHLLLKTDYPVYYVRSGPGYLHISDNLISKKSLEEPISSTGIRIATCPDCGNLAVQKEEGNISCVNCMPHKHPLPPVYTSLTECDRMISNPDKYTKDDKISMGLHLLSLCTLQKASPDLSQVIRHYVTGAGNQIGYQPLLIFVTTLIYNLDDQQTISLEGITSQIKKLVLPQNYHVLDKIIPLTTNAWLKRGWIYKPNPDKKGFYARSQKLPSLEKSADDQSADEK